MDSNRHNRSSEIKFLYSYGGRIIPRRSDGALRYVGGFTRVLSVLRSITFSELTVKFVELCGTSMSLKCKLPKEDLDLLISIQSDEDLQSIVGEYDREVPDSKIRAVLFPIASSKQVSPPCSPVLTADSTPATRPHSKIDGRNCNRYPPSPPSRRKQYDYSPLSVCSYAAGRREDVPRYAGCRHQGYYRQLNFVPYSNYYQ